MFDLRHCVVLDDSRPGTAQLFLHPSDLIVAHELRDVPSALAAMQAALAAGHHLAGYLTYALGYALEPSLNHLMPADRTAPLLWFGVFDGAPIQLDATHANALWPQERVYASPLKFEWDRRAYHERFGAIHAAIRAGEIYEANLSMRARFKLTGDPRAFYGRLRQQAQVADGAFVDDGERQVLSLSPELFFAIDVNGQITTRPMKGTAARHSDPAADDASKQALQASAKNRAENLMIVDLLRNDLGRIAKTGSVEVPALFTLETYPTVYQLTSIVRAQLVSGCEVGAVLKALFPCGSVTGAPKIRAMQILREVEVSPRGAYCGAIGMFAPDGSASFNVAIRTLAVHDGEGELGVGGAIVADSRADDEYDECLLKARFFEAGRHPISLLETMAYTGDAWPRRSRHLQRMQNSARALGIPFRTADADAALDAAVGSSSTVPRRVRLTLHDDGTLAVTTAPLPERRASLSFLVFSDPIGSTDPLNGYKTNWRDVCERALAWARARACDEAVLVNERGELSEGTYTNVFIQRGGHLFTPPLASGCLPGCLRAELLARGECEEAVLTIDDLQQADRVYLGNSLRGLVPAIQRSPTHFGLAIRAGHR